jgi:hypothetical protein
MELVTLKEQRCNRVTSLCNFLYDSNNWDRHAKFCMAPGSLAYLRITNGTFLYVNCYEHGGGEKLRFDQENVM